MHSIAFMFLLAASSRVELVDQTYVIPANDWRFVDLGLRQRPALVQAEFKVEAGPAVQVMLMEHADLERLNRGESHGSVAATPVQAEGFLQARTGKPGDYVVVVENRSGRTDEAKVRLHLWVDFDVVTQISRQRQLAVISISLAVFLAIVSYSARRIWLGVRS